MAEGGRSGFRKFLMFIGIAIIGLALAFWLLILRNAAEDPAAIQETPISEGGSLDGAWTLVPNDSFGSFAGFRIDEEFVGAIKNTATGRTNEVSGKMEIKGSAVTSATITASLSALTSEPQFRVDALKGLGLETVKFPEATFVLVTPIALRQPQEKGVTNSFDATGDLTLHGVTRRVTIPLEGRWDGTTIQVVGHLPISLTEYGIVKPTTPRVASIADAGELEIQLFFLKQ